MINEIGALLTSDPTEIGELEEKLHILLLKEASLKKFDREIGPSVECEALEEEVSGSAGYAERISVAKNTTEAEVQGTRDNE